MDAAASTAAAAAAAAAAAGSAAPSAAAAAPEAPAPAPAAADPAPAAAAPPATATATTPATAAGASAATASTASSASGVPCWARREARAGEVAVVMGKGDLTYVTLAAGASLVNKLGEFKHGDAEGTAFGAEWKAAAVVRKQRYRDMKRKRRAGEAGKGAAGAAGAAAAGGEEGAEPEPEAEAEEEKRAFLRLMAATPEMWTRALRHRTQIIYSVDVAFVVFHLDLKPGAVVLETGTGSGSLTLALARAVAPTGRVHTFEFNADRVDKAKEDFARLGVTELVTVKHCDATSPAGFGIDGQADAVFFDLPNPWEAVGNAARALRGDVVTRICSFSPCAEQITRTHAALAAHGFVQIRGFECIAREMEPYLYDAFHEHPPLWDPSPNPAVYNPGALLGPRTARGTGFRHESATHTGYLVTATRFPVVE